MAKKNDVTKPVDDTANAQDGSNPNALATTPQHEPDTALVSILSDGNPLFMERYGKVVERVSTEIPTPMDFMKILDALPEEYADAINEIITRTSSQKRGVYTSNERPDMPELRIYHGTGNDMNRPENQRPGEFYLTTKENVGKEFHGTVLLVYEGNTMWPPNDATGSRGMPQCISMDRRVGSSYGDCKVCPNRPWKDGKINSCGNDVVAVMLTKNLKDIVLVRFQKTSEAAGRMLLKYSKRGTIGPWARWYKIVLEEEKRDRNRWFKMRVEPSEEYVPEALHPFCGAMCTVLEAKQFLPSLANVYRQAQEVLGDSSRPVSAANAPMAGPAPAAGDENYGDMNDAPDEGTNV